ncbi:hypothetical protein CR513_05484, partial [Mucuna pruriens]
MVAEVIEGEIEREVQKREGREKEVGKREKEMCNREGKRERKRGTNKREGGKGREVQQNGHISDSTSIQLLFEISQTLHDNMEFMNVKDDYGQVAHSISRFVHMVDYGAEMEHHLAFLVDCRGAFGRLSELKETLVHSSNSLAIQALKCATKHPSFVKSCVTFSEVTIPSVSAHRQFDLFLETAEVALLGGLVSHSDGLIDSAISCLHTSDIVDGFRTPTDVEGLIPGNDMLYYGDSSYNQELVSLCNLVLENLLSAVQQEPSQAARGIMALEACNCIASSLMVK